MSDADEFRPPAERNERMPVLEPDRAARPEARYAETWQLVEENAAVRVDSAFRHEPKNTPRLRHYGALLLYHRRGGGAGLVPAGDNAARSSTRELD